MMITVRTLLLFPTPFFVAVAVWSDANNRTLSLSCCYRVTYPLSTGHTSHLRFLFCDPWRIQASAGDNSRHWKEKLDMTSPFSSIVK